MPSRSQSSSGYRGVRARPNGLFFAEIHSGDDQVSLGNFKTAHEAARAYDATTLRLGRSRWGMNFPDVRSAQDLAPPPRLVTDEDRRLHRRRATLNLVAERDERTVVQWRASHLREAAEEAEYWETRAGRAP